MNAYRQERLDQERLHQERLHQEQLSLFPAAGREKPPAYAAQAPVDSLPVGRVQARTVMVNPHLLAARRLARKMRRLPDRSAAETRAGLAICAQLKAYLADAEAAATGEQTPRH